MSHDHGGHDSAGPSHASEEPRAGRSLVRVARMRELLQIDEDAQIDAVSGSTLVAIADDDEKHAELVALAVETGKSQAIAIRLDRGIREIEEKNRNWRRRKIWFTRLDKLSKLAGGAAFAAGFGAALAGGAVLASTTFITVAAMAAVGWGAAAYMEDRVDRWINKEASDIRSLADLRKRIETAAAAPQLNESGDAKP